MKPKTAKKVFDLFNKSLSIVLADLNPSDRETMFRAHDVIRKVCRESNPEDLVAFTDSEVLFHEALEVFAERDPKA